MEVAEQHILFKLVEVRAKGHWMKHKRTANMTVEQLKCSSMVA